MGSHALEVSQKQDKAMACISQQLWLVVTAVIFRLI